MTTFNVEWRSSTPEKIIDEISPGFGCWLCNPAATKNLVGSIILSVIVAVFRGTDEGSGKTTISKL